MKTAAIAAWVLIAVSGPALTPASVDAQHFPPAADLETMLRYLVEDGETPGIVLGVLEADGSTSVVAYGTAGAGEGELGPGTPFPLGALTMTFTGTLLGEMVERGVVGLDDPVAEHLPAGVMVPVYGDHEITLGDLATHRSGLPAGPAAWEAELTREALYRRVSEHELERAPGRRYRFSTIGYALLGEALSGAAGVGYAELLRERVLEPLGMEETGYAPEGGAEAMRGATGLWSSAEDLLKFLAANARPGATELGPALRMAQEIRVDRGSPDEDEGYGFSWRTYTIARQPPVLTHAGGTAESSVRLSLQPGAGIGTILLASTGEFEDWIGRELLFPEPPSSRGSVEVDRALLAGYVGTYQSGVGTYTASPARGHYFIRLEDEGYLTYQPRGKVRTRLYADSDSTFFMLRSPYTVAFQRAGDDVRMTMRVDEREPELAGYSRTAWRVDRETPEPRVAAKNTSFWASWGAEVWAALVAALVLVLVLVSRPVWAPAVRAT